MRNQLQTLRILIPVILLTLPLVSACVSLEREPAAEAGSTLTIQNAWARSYVAGENSAVYLEITNTGDVNDRLTAADTAIAGATEVHHVVSEDNVMKMQEVDSIVVGAGETVALEPGSLHIMLFDLLRDLNVGDEFEIALTFEDAGDITAIAEVREHTFGHGHSGTGGQ